MGAWVGVTQLTCMPLIVFQHVDLLGKLAVALFTLILFDAFVKLHVVPQSVFGLHSCQSHVTHICTSARAEADCLNCTLQKEFHRPFPHSAHRKSRISSCTRRCSFSMSFLAKDLLHLSQRWLFTPEIKRKKKEKKRLLGLWVASKNRKRRRKRDEMEDDKRMKRMQT